LQAAVGAPDGDIALLSFAGEVSEARGIARLVHWLVTRKGVAAPEILILMRSDHHNQFSKRIKEELQRSRIEFSDPESINRVLNDETTRKALSLFRLAINREDSLAWATLLHIAPGIGDAVFDHVYEEARDTRGTFGGTLIVQSQNDLPGVARAPATRTISLVRDAIRWIETHPVPEAKPEQGWAEWILESLGGVTAPVSPEFRALLVTVDQLIEPTDELERYLSQIGPVARDNALAKGAGVRIMTMASSKGLTVEAAIVCGLETGLIPMDGRDLAEERRLLYVAMTRAKKYLFGTWAQQRGGPTARAGRGQVRQRRRSSTFLEGGPVRSQDGTRYLNNLDGGAAQA
jgi:DNA helicase-2/ATP-dependent DNA helicase PcrA